MRPQFRAPFAPQFLVQQFARLVPGLRAPVLVLVDRPAGDWAQWAFLPAVEADIEAALDRLRIESNLNAVAGSRRLVEGRRTAVDEWLDSFAKLEQLCRNEDDGGALLQSCLYRLLRINPLDWCR